MCSIDLYVTVNPKPSEEPGEIFVKLSTQVSTISSLMQAWVVTISAALQGGARRGDFSAKYRHANSSRPTTSTQASWTPSLGMWTTWSMN